MELPLDKRIEIVNMIQEAGLTFDTLENGENFFASLVEGKWTTFDDYKMYYVCAFSIFKVIEFVFYGMSIQDIKKTIFDVQAGVRHTIMQEASQIFSNLTPIIEKLNQKYTKLGEISRMVALDANLTFDPGI